MRSYSEIRRVVFNSQPSRINIYPNPARDNITVATNNMKAVMITSVAGKILVQKELKNARQTTINVAALAKGIYVVKVLCNTAVGVGYETVLSKFVKE